MTTYVADVAEFEPGIDWAKVHDLRAVVVRAGFGPKRGVSRTTDHAFAHHWKGVGKRSPHTIDELLKHGIRRMAYWYAYPDSGNDGPREANAFIGTLRRASGSVLDTDGIALDAEDRETFGKLSKRERRKFCDSFMATCEDHLQRRGLFYTGVPFSVEMFGADYSPLNWKTWISRYDNDPPPGPESPEWRDIPIVRRMLLWQYTGDGQGDRPRGDHFGLPANCDLSRVVGASEASFLRYGNKR